MSPEKASAVCTFTLGVEAFQPKRPRAIFPVSGSRTRLGRPEMPSPSASCGSAFARMSAS